MSRSELNRYFKLKTKKRFILCDIRFLKYCKIHKVFPNFIHVSIKPNNNRTQFAEHVARRIWMKKEMDFLYSKLNGVEFELYVLHLKITKNLTDVEFNCFKEYDTEIYEIIEHKLISKHRCLKSKLRDLIRNRDLNVNGGITPRSQTLFEQCELVKNLSSEEFSTEELSVLKKGLNFALEPLKPPLEDIVSDIENGIWHLPNEEKEEIRLASKEVIENFPRIPVSNKVKNHHRIVKNLKKKDCFYTKADKGNCIVIMDKSDYHNRVTKLIDEGPYIKLNKDPLPKMEIEIDLLLKKYQVFFTDPHWRLKLKNSNARVPRLYALPKIHKPGEDIRPICSNINAPTSKISKWLLNEFNKLVKPDGLYVINTKEFIDRVKDVKLTEDEVLVSYDVQALFPSVPIRETLMVIREWLHDQNIEDWRAELYVELTHLCMEQNIFTYNNDWYRQTDGTAMGNSLSPFIANLFMCFLENRIKNEPGFPRIWIRYVDDIFAVQNKNRIQDTLNLINSQFNTIKFTHEMESQGTLPFLDVLVIKQDENLEFDIYRKPTHTPRFICGDSFHSVKQKYAPFHNMIHRLYSVPMNRERFKKEKEYILNLGKFNNLEEEVILKIMKKKEREYFYKNQITLKSDNDTQNKGKFIKMTHYPMITEKLDKIFKKHDIKLAHSSSLKLRSLLGSTKDKINNMDKSGVYKVKCNGCSFCYVGMTRRKIKTRIKDHLSDIKNKTDKTALARHIKEENAALGRGRRLQKQHNITESDFKLVKECYDYKQLCIWESINIMKEKRTALNDNNGLADSTLTRLFMSSLTVDG